MTEELKNSRLSSGHDLLVNISPGLEGYLSAATAILRDRLGQNLVSAALTGSASFDDRRAASDVDVIVVVASKVALSIKEALVQDLSHRVLPCPAHGLDLGVYRADQLKPIRREPEFELGLATGAEWDDEIDYGGVYAGGILDLEICRVSGTRLYGTSPQELISPVPAAWIRDEVAKTLSWHRTHLYDPFHDPFGASAVLNGARAWLYLTEGILTSKSKGAEWAMARSDFSKLLRQTLDTRESGRGERLDRDEVLGFLDEVEAYLR